MKRFSIIVCTYNRDQYIYETLSRIAYNDYSKDKYEIVLINNNCTDETEDECFRFRKENPDVDFRYYVETNQGLSFARNRGIAESYGEFLIFLDDDSFVSETYLSNLDKYLLKYTDVSAFGGAISPLYEEGNEPVWMSRWTYSWVSAINMGNKVSLFKGNKYPIGANMGFRKSVLEKYGNFNVDLGRSLNNLMAGEEKDIFYRIKSAGEKIYYFPSILVRHVIPSKRTTMSYIRRMGYGVGVSERLRCESLGRCALFMRFMNEIIKWCASIVLLLYYLISFRKDKGFPLVVFRYDVTRGLLGL